MPAGQILDLRGAAYDRGRLQAQLSPDRIADVTVAVTRRLRELGPALAVPKVVEWLDAQHAFMRENDPDGFVEVQGIAEGFGIAADALFACSYGNVVADLAGEPALADACTAWATTRAEGGTVVVKNRDSRGAQSELERVFRHIDPEWAGRRILCVGSLGAPGAFAGGINTDGLAVADTQVGTTDHGEGWLRPFLMTRLLRECTTVAEAVALVFRVPHAGGGTLLMGDATGAVAAIELAHRASPPRSRASATTWRAPIISSATVCADAISRASTTSAAGPRARDSRRSIMRCATCCSLTRARRSGRSWLAMATAPARVCAGTTTGTTCGRYPARSSTVARRRSTSRSARLARAPGNASHRSPGGRAGEAGLIGP